MMIAHYSAIAAHRTVLVLDQMMYSVLRNEGIGTEIST